MNVVNQFPSVLQALLVAAWALLWAGCPSCHPAVSVRALKETQSTGPSQWFGLILSLSNTGFLKEGALRCAVYDYNTASYASVSK